MALHRFGSHLLQSTLIALQYFSSKDENSSSHVNKKVTAKHGELLRTSPELVVDISDQVASFIPEALRDQFASHIMRTILLILSGQKIVGEQVRSKKSKAFQKDNKFAALLASREQESFSIPPSFGKALRSLLDSTFTVLSNEDEVKGLCVDPIAGPTLALIIRSNVPLDPSMDAKRTSLLNICLDSTSSDDDRDRSAHVETLLRDNVGSHVLEAIVGALDSHRLRLFWSRYVQGRLGKLGSHPTANYVIAAALRHVDASLFQDICKEISTDGEALVHNQRLGIFSALVERGSNLGAFSDEQVKDFWQSERTDCVAVQCVLAAFDFNPKHDGKEGSALVRALLSSKTRKDLKKENKKRLKRDSANKPDKKRKREQKEVEDGEDGDGDGDVPDILKVTVQGSLLCQAIGRLKEPAQVPLLESILALEDLLTLARDPTAVHVLLALLQSTQLAFSQRSRLSTRVLSELVGLLNDKFGSRVVDAAFDRSDIFFKEKMAKSCLQHERLLLSSVYGRYFLKRCQIGTYRRDVQQWKQQIKAAQQQEVEKQHLLPASKAPQVTTNKTFSKLDQDLDAILTRV